VSRDRPEPHHFEHAAQSLGLRRGEFDELDAVDSERVLGFGDRFAIQRIRHLVPHRTFAASNCTSSRRLDRQPRPERRNAQRSEKMKQYRILERFIVEGNTRERKSRGRGAATTRRVTWNSD
jgi:hypothetical protein